MSSLPFDDDALLDELRGALEPSYRTVAEQVQAAGRAAFSFRTMEEELAALVYDSLAEPALAGAGRAVSDARTIVFESGDVSVEMEISDEGVVGQVVPSSGVELTAEGADGTRTAVVADEMGCFTLPATGRKPVRLHVRTTDVSAVTAWTHLDPSG